MEDHLEDQAYHNDDSRSVSARVETSQSTISESRKKRTRSNLACDTCRTRRTKCDGKKPSCTYCRNRGTECHYQQPLEAKLSRTDIELLAINKRLDHLTSLLETTARAPVTNEESTANALYGGEGINQDDSPFRLLGTASMMRVLGLGANFAEELTTLERSTQHALGSATRFFIVQHQQAISALAAFSEYVHVWYPILRPGLSEQYLQVISGPLTPSSESCLVLLIAAIGCLAQNTYVDLQNEHANTPYFEAALACLPAVIADCSITSVQCLVLLSIYYCCLMRPCQAHDYSLIASFKVQNLLKRPENDGGDVREHIRRAYWAILLLESELSVQFNVAKSGIWSLDEHMPLPDSRRTWQFSAEEGSPLTSSTSPASVQLTPSACTDKVQSYFMAEIAMRRMLHRCNTAIKKTADGRWIYAPWCALELELQLDEWYNYLPDMIRFNISLEQGADGILRDCPLTNFLRVQYHCCKISIYWPAVYQAVQNGSATGQLLDHCRRFFDSYIQLMPSLLIAFESCLVNRWTLFASIFMTSMATMKAIKTPCLSGLCSPQLYQTLSSSIQVNRDVVRKSPSLEKMLEILHQRVSNDYETPV